MQIIQVQKILLVDIVIILKFRNIEPLKKFGTEKFVNEVFKNKQRTSTKNGILKGEAVLRVLKILQKRSVEYFQDVHKLYDDVDFENKVKLIPGQKSGISLKYFLCYQVLITL